MIEPKITMEWDGSTPEAILWLDQVALHGQPMQVQAAFDLLNKLRDEWQHRGLVLERIADRAEEIAAMAAKEE